MSDSHILQRWREREDIMAFYRGKRSAWAEQADAALQNEPLRQPLGSNSPLFDDFEPQNDQSGPVEAELLDLCRSLRHACAAMEAWLDRHTSVPLNHRAKPPQAAARPLQSRSRNADQHYDFDEQDEHYTPEPAAISMRDMTGFLLSREGEHFLNLVRRMIREEMAQSGAESEKFEPARPAPRDAIRPDMAQSSLRDILRRQDSGRHDSGRQDSVRQESGRQQSGAQNLPRRRAGP